MSEEIFSKFSWFFELGYVTIIATIVSMVLTNFWKVTILKKSLSNADDDAKDKILSTVGTLTSLLIYGLVYVINIMLVQETFDVTTLSINWDSAWISIVSGASVTWVAAKGLYTALHKFFSRIKSNKSNVKEVLADTAKDLGELQKLVDQEKANPKAVNNAIGSLRRR